jgi:hypothetical protein
VLLRADILSRRPIGVERDVLEDAVDPRDPASEFRSNSTAARTLRTSPFGHTAGYTTEYRDGPRDGRR